MKTYLLYMMNDTAVVGLATHRPYQKMPCPQHKGEMMQKYFNYDKNGLNDGKMLSKLDQSEPSTIIHAF